MHPPHILNSTSGSTMRSSSFFVPWHTRHRRIWALFFNWEFAKCSFGRVFSQPQHKAFAYFPMPQHSSHFRDFCLVPTWP